MAQTTPEQVAEARRLYAEGAPIAEIVSMFGVAHSTLYRWLNGGPSRGGAPALASVPRRSVVQGSRPHRAPEPPAAARDAAATAPAATAGPAAKRMLRTRPAKEKPAQPKPEQPKARRRAGSGSRRSLVRRLWRTAARQVREIEERLARTGVSTQTRERDARVLATLVKTLRELDGFDALAGSKAGKSQTGDNGDDGFPHDLEELRRELTRRVDELRRRRAAAGAAGDGAA